MLDKQIIINKATMMQIVMTTIFSTNAHTPLCAAAFAKSQITNATMTHKHKRLTTSEPTIMGNAAQKYFIVSPPIQFLLV